MIFEGNTSCPVCATDITRSLKDVFRKSEDDDSYHIQCPQCNNADIIVAVRIRYHLSIRKDYRYDLR